MNCRICNSDLYKFLSLGEMPLANNFLKKDQLDVEEPKFPLNLCFCNSCGLVQLDYIVPPDAMFKDYIYFSSTSDLLKEHFSDLAKDVESRFLNEGGLVVEIASNDGLVLKNFDSSKIRTLGIEPAENIAAFANKIGIETINEYWNSKLASRIMESREQADVIIANNVFPHVHDLDDFVRGVSILLKDGGVAVIQFQYLIDFIEKLEYDTIYHEHVSYISLYTTMKLLDKYGLRVFDVKRFPNIHGGSVRFYIGRNQKQEKAVADLLEYEKKNGFTSKDKYDDFSRRVEKHRTGFVDLLKKLKSEGKRIVGYGAAAKANTMLNYCGVGTETIRYIADKSEHKQGLFTPRAHIPVVDPEKILKDMPDYVIILAWNFANEIMEQQKQYGENGGRFIIPIPTPRVVE